MLPYIIIRKHLLKTLHWIKIHIFLHECWKH